MNSFISTKTSVFIGTYLSFKLLYLLLPDRILKSPIPDVRFAALISVLEMIALLRSQNGKVNCMMT